MKLKTVNLTSMTESDAKATNQIRRLLGSGDLILALDRLYGARRAASVAALYGHKEIFPIPSCAAIQIMNIGQDISTLLNALDEDDIMWCSLDDNKAKTYYPGKRPFFETYCCFCSDKIKTNSSDQVAFHSGVQFQIWDARCERIVLYECTILRSVCLKCQDKAKIKIIESAG
jgi:hypothetical protein